MTDDPPQNDEGRLSSTGPLPAESRAARSLTDRSKAEELPPGEIADAQEPSSGPRIWPRVVGVLILLLGAGGAWLWQNPGFIGSSWHALFSGQSGPAAETASLDALDTRVSKLERQYQASLALAQRVDSLESRLSSPDHPPVASGQVSQQPDPDLSSVVARLDALEGRSRQPSQSAGSSVELPISAATDLGPVLSRIDALEKRTGQNAVESTRIDALATRVDRLAGADTAADVRGKLDAVETRINELAANQTKLAGTTERATRAARMQAAEIALAAGRPLGSIADAPPALTRYDSSAPPTEAGLRLSFPAAAQAAVKVSRPETDGKPFFDRVLAQLRESRLITVREGDDVVIGNATAMTLARAQVLLDAGDLSGAVRQVGSLSGPPGEKMATWLADAKALLAAREALASLAESH